MGIKEGVQRVLHFIILNRETLFMFNFAFCNNAGGKWANGLT